MSPVAKASWFLTCALFACSSSTAPAPSVPPDGAAGSGGAAGAASFLPEPGCRGDADCASGGSCAHFAGAGPSICVKPEAPASACVNTGRDECCASADCTSGDCFTVSRQPVQCSSTAGVDTYNVCLADACQQDGDCATGQVCTPVGFEPARLCVAAACTQDADCNAEPDGYCVLTRLGCCPPRVGGNVLRPTALACAYASDGCQSDADCPSGFCVVESGRARCASDCR